MVASLLLAATLVQGAAYRIDPAAAEAGFDLKATMHTVHGTTRKLEGQVTVDPESDSTLKLSGRITVDTASLVTGSDRRDATMHEKTLAVATYPGIVFEPERFVASGPPRPDGSLPGSLSGRLTIRGKSRAQTMATTLTVREDRISAEGRFDVGWADFGIPDPSFLFVHIESTVHAHFRAEFVAAR